MARGTFNRAELRDGPGRKDVLSVLEVIIDAADPYALVSQALHVSHGVVHVGSRSLPLDGRRICVIGLGKACRAMAQAAERALGDVLKKGVIVVPSDQALPLGQRWDVVGGGHPLPSSGSAAAAAAIDRLVSEVSRDDVVLCLLSGGGSALAASPQPGLTMSDLQAMTRLLLATSVPIAEVNQVRSHLTTLGGGGLARRLRGVDLLTLALSDVVGSRPETIASGPTSPDPSTFADAARILRSHGLWASTPPSVRERLERGSRGHEMETPKPGDAVFSNASYHLLADGQSCLRRAADYARSRGWEVLVTADPVTGEARETGQKLGRELRALSRRRARPVLWLGAGETTVTLHGHGRGGRNQEAALAAAIELKGTRGACIAWLATDGIDGESGAAGAIVDGETVGLGRVAGCDELAALDDNDSYSFLSASKDLLMSGPTGTNVADIVAAYIVRDCGGEPGACGSD